MFKKLASKIKKLFGRNKKPKVVEVEIPQEVLDSIMKDFRKELRNKMKSL